MEQNIIQYNCFAKCLAVNKRCFLGQSFRNVSVYEYCSCTPWVYGMIIWVDMTMSYMYTRNVRCTRRVAGTEASIPFPV